MKVALIDGQPTSAEPSAPQTATCPSCGGTVKLRCRTGTYFWRHERILKSGCSARRGQPLSNEDRNLDAIARKCGGTVFNLRTGEALALTGPGIVVLITPPGETN